MACMHSNEFLGSLKPMDSRAPRAAGSCTTWYNSTDERPASRPMHEHSVATCFLVAVIIVISLGERFTCCTAELPARLSTERHRARAVQSNGQQLLGDNAWIVQTGAGTAAEALPHCS